MKKFLTSMLLSFLFFSVNVFAQDNLLTTINVGADQFFETSLIKIVNKVAVTPKGDRIVTGAKGLVVWDAASGNKLIEYWGHGTNNWIFSLDISQTGSMVISGANGSGAKVWDIETGQDIQSINTFIDSENILDLSGLPAVTGAAFKNSGKVAVTANNTGVVQIWDISSGEEIDRFEKMGNIRSIQLIPNSDILIVQKLSSFYLLNLNSGEKTGLMRGSNVSVSESGNRIVFTRDEKILVNSLNGLIFLKEKEFELERLQSVKNIAISPNGSGIITGKVGNFNEFNNENILFDRELISIDNEVKVVRLPKAANPPLNDKNEFMVFNHNYNDDEIVFFPDGGKYLTVNGANVMIWSYGR